MVSKKEDYRLWVEFLKRSENYRDFCKWRRSEEKEPNAVPEKYLDKDGRPSPLLIAMFSVYRIFGDIFTIPFNEWWGLSRDRLKLFRKKRDGAMADYLDFLEVDIDSHINKFKRSEGREPSLEEFKRYFVNEMKASADSYFDVQLYLRVDLLADTEELLSAFRKMLQGKKKSRKYAKGRCLYRDAYLKPAGRIERDKLKKYLAVYDLFKKGHKWSEILRQVEPRREEWNPIDDENAYESYKDYDRELNRLENDKRQMYMYKQKAERIIENTERGFFPGNYQ